jgi:hypothetical protein
LPVVTRQDGRGLYGFLHLTFEEYFAAVHLAEQWLQGGTHVLTPLLHNPRWTEVLLLAVGRLGDVSPFLATQFVQAILEAEDPYENILSRHLLLAARCLADDVRVEAAVRHSIVKRILTLYFAPRTPQALRSDVLATLSTFAGTLAEEKKDGVYRWTAPVRGNDARADLTERPFRGAWDLSELGRGAERPGTHVPDFHGPDAHARPPPCRA